MQLHKDFIRGVIPEATFFYNALPQSATFSIDSRTINKGEIFVALKGVNTDGHKYVQAAIEAGASGCFVAQEQFTIFDNVPKRLLEKVSVIAVPDPLKALVALAAAWRQKLTCPVIGITGSMGKTFTKEMASGILTAAGVPHVASSGNQNTILGVCLNILKAEPHHKVLLLEMGINKRGEMARLADIARPTAAVITAIGHSHMEGLGSIIDIAAEKRDIFKYFKEDSIGIINGDQQLLAGIAYAHPVVKFGSKTTNQIQARKIQVGAEQVTFIMKLYKERILVRLQTNHKGAVYNALASTAIAHLLGISAKHIIEGITSVASVPGRFEKRILKKGKGILINDCYNACPETMKSALLAFQAIKTNAQKVAVLGDMLELGVNSSFWHRQLARFLRKVPSLRQVILVGTQWNVKMVPLGIKVDLVPNWQEAVLHLQQKLNQESLILVKGSNGMGLTNLVK
jgi:UDP-N-acetylmuramoyl-tripeptide--D-alanyl-D-alanine ligase